MTVIRLQITSPFSHSLSTFMFNSRAFISLTVFCLSLFYFQLVKMFAVIVLLFAINYFPVHVFSIIQDVFPEINYFFYIKLIYLVVMLFANSNCCHSPIIYCWMNAKFRQGFKGVFECIFLAGMCRGKGCGPKIHHQKHREVVITRSTSDFPHSPNIRRAQRINDKQCHSVV